MFDALLVTEQFLSVMFKTYRVPTPPGKSSIFCKISSCWTVLENDCGLRKYRIFKLKVLEFAGTWTQWCGREHICVHTPLVFVIRSYSDKTSCDSDNWWTLQCRCYCCTRTSRVSNCYLSLYLHVAGDYDRVLDDTFGVLKSRAGIRWKKWIEIFGHGSIRIFEYFRIKWNLFRFKWLWRQFLRIVDTVWQFGSIDCLKTILSFLNDITQVKFSVPRILNK